MKKPKRKKEKMEREREQTIKEKKINDVINMRSGGGTHAQSRNGSLRNNVIRPSVRLAVVLYARDDAASADLFSAIVSTRTHGAAAGSERATRTPLDGRKRRQHGRRRRWRRARTHNLADATARRTGVRQKRRRRRKIVLHTYTAVDSPNERYRCRRRRRRSKRTRTAGDTDDRPRPHHVVTESNADDNNTQLKT